MESSPTDKTISLLNRKGRLVLFGGAAVIVLAARGLAPSPFYIHTHTQTCFLLFHSAHTFHQSFSP